jgi:signal peptidase I
MFNEVTAPVPATATLGPQRLSRSRPVQLRRRMLDWVVIVICGVLVAMIMRSTVVQTFVIPSESMVPTLVTGDRVVVDKFSYRFRDPQRGDIVVFSTPPGVDGPYDQLVKRIVGIPGDVVEARDQQVFVNGEKLPEGYLARDMPTEALAGTVVAPGRYLVLGDNRSNSSDGRSFGTIERKTLIGRAVLRAFPFHRVGRPN